MYEGWSICREGADGAGGLACRIIDLRHSTALLVVKRCFLGVLYFLTSDEYLLIITPHGPFYHADSPHSLAHSLSPYQGRSGWRSEIGHWTNDGLLLTFRAVSTCVRIWIPLKTPSSTSPRGPRCIPVCSRDREVAPRELSRSRSDVSPMRRVLRVLRT